MSKYTNDFIRLSLFHLLEDEDVDLKYNVLNLNLNCFGSGLPYWFFGNQYVELHSEDSPIFDAGDLLNITYADLQENYFEDILHPTQLELDFFKLQLGYDWPFTKEMKQDD